MAPVCGKPILEHQLECLRRQGVTRIILSVGHLHQVIEDYFGDGGKRSPVTGEPFGVRIEYMRENEPLGTAGALYYMKKQITEDFLLVNGDLIFDFDLNRFYRFHKKAGTVASIFVHPNDHPFDSGIVMMDEKNIVRKWLHKEEERGWYKNRVNAGIHFFSPEIFELFHTLEKKDLDRDILRPLLADGQLSGYYSSEYVKDVGTPIRLEEVEADVRSGRIAAKNLTNRQQAVFLDRDGVIN
jgi:D-glycero-D-manno-heptose 1,7-bisphosphate phosphatase